MTSGTSGGDTRWVPPPPRVPAGRAGAVAVAVGTAAGQQHQPDHAAHLPPRCLPCHPLVLLPAACPHRYVQGPMGGVCGCGRVPQQDPPTHPDPPGQHPAAAGPTVPWLWMSGATPWTPRRRRRASTGTSGQRGHGCGEAGRGGGLRGAQHPWVPPRHGSGSLPCREAAEGGPEGGAAMEPPQAGQGGRGARGARGDPHPGKARVITHGRACTPTRVRTHGCLLR